MDTVAGKPLEIDEIIKIGGEDGILTLGPFHCKILSLPEGFPIEVIEIVGGHGYKWGIVRSAKSGEIYGYNAVILEEAGCE
ncbi:MAG: hypothetical protein IKW90_09135 [Lachnospiraceae bacterium]|nr:hypothetical protein [Lachnospiraceae bacterium]